MGTYRIHSKAVKEDPLFTCWSDHRGFLLTFRGLSSKSGVLSVLPDLTGVHVPMNRKVKWVRDHTDISLEEYHSNCSVSKISANVTSLVACPRHWGCCPVMDITGWWHCDLYTVELSVHSLTLVIRGGWYVSVPVHFWDVCITQGNVGSRHCILAIQIPPVMTTATVSL